MIKLLKQYITEKKRANDLKERELNLLYDPDHNLDERVLKEQFSP